MNDKLPDDLLSAYFDGEVTPEERAAAERAKAASPEAARKLSEAAQLSRRLRALPVEQAPSELVSRVMQQAERRMLLAPTAPVSRRRRVWLYGTGSVVASFAAVALLVMVLNIGSGLIPDPERAPSVRGIASRSSEENISPLGGEGRESGVRDARDGAAAMALDSARSTSGIAPPASELGGTETSNEIGSDFTSNNSGAPSGGMASTSNTMASGPIEFDEDLASADVGEIVEAVQRRGNRLAVVRLTVVDRRQGLESLEMVLARNDALSEDDLPESSLDRGGVGGGVPEDQELKELPDAGRPASKPMSGESSDLVCVWFEGTSEQLTAALEDLRRETAFQGQQVGVAPPIEIAQLDEMSQVRISKLESDRPESQSKDAADSESAPATAEPLASKSNDDKSAMRQRTGGRAKRESDEKPPSDAPTKAIMRRGDSSSRKYARQMRVEVHPQLEQSLKQQSVRQLTDNIHDQSGAYAIAKNLPTSSRQSQRRLPAIAPRPEQAGESAALAENSSPPIPVQVLFVLTSPVDHVPAHESGRHPEAAPPAAEPAAPPAESNGEPRSERPRVHRGRRHVS